MKAAILQSNYIPWKGYFDIINSVDKFIVFDEAQYTKSDWRNRNRIKTEKGLLWLSIPIDIKGKLGQKISEAKVSDSNWNRKHWETIKMAYSKAPYFCDYKEIFEFIYLKELEGEVKLSKINLTLIRTINNILGIKTEILIDKNLEVIEGKTERLIDLCKKVQATTYLSGPAAKNYLNESLFESENIKVEWMEYSNYKEYPQLYPPFESTVSILDLIFNTGKTATNFMKSFNEN